MQAVGDKNDVDESLAETAIERDDAEQALAAAEAERDDAEQALTTAEAERDDAEQALTESEQATVAFLALSIGAGTTIDEDTALCVADALYEVRGASSLGALALAGTAPADLTPNDIEFVADLSRAVEQCGTTLEELATGVDATVTPLPADGDQAVADILYGQCAASSGKACDALLLFSEPFSEYEAFALTCGERFSFEDAPLFCEDNI
jgi:hypothetical protein